MCVGVGSRNQDATPRNHHGIPIGQGSLLASRLWEKKDRTKDPVRIIFYCKSGRRTCNNGLHFGFNCDLKGPPTKVSHVFRFPGPFGAGKQRVKSLKGHSDPKCEPSRKVRSKYTEAK
jgi:hypothetical protein